MGIPNRSKVPLRGISKLFTDLSPAIRSKLESAFVEAEQQINYHNRSVINSQERRRKSSYVSAPVIVLTNNSRGFDVTWDRLEDRLISFYEAQVSLNSNFADITSYKLTETSLSVEGVGTNVFIRVRGVRWDGDTGNWSNTVSMGEVTTGGPVTYSRGFDDVEPFYIDYPGTSWDGPIQHISIDPERQNGGLMIFGSIAFGPNVVGAASGDPLVIVTLNGVNVVQIADTEMITNFGGDNSTGLGPVFVPHDLFYFSETQAMVARTRFTSGSHSSTGVHTPWTAANPTVYSVSIGVGNGNRDAQTNDVNFDNFGFLIPSGNTITGIKVTYTTTDNNFDTGIYDNANLFSIKLLDAGVPRADKVASPDWGNSAQSYGDASDKWGEVLGYWTAAKINHADFGVQLRGKVFMPAAASTRTISMTWPTITVYSVNETTGSVDVQIRVNVDPLQGPEGLTACTLNVIEFGDAL